MGLHLGKFVHTKSGKIIMSIILGFGLASLFRTVCQNDDCLMFYAPPLEKIEDKIYKTSRSDKKCVKYKPVATKCSINTKTLTFE
jgi:hypothetical protein